jgi:hypothetical protein
MTFKQGCKTIERPKDRGITTGELELKKVRPKILQFLWCESDGLSKRSA